MSRATASRRVEAATDRPVVVACGLGRALRVYVDDGLRVRCDVQYVDTFDQLDAQLDALVRCDVLVLPPQDTTGRSAESIIARVVRHWRETGVVVFFPANAEEMPPAVTMVRAGAHELVYEGVHPTAGKLALAVESARRFVSGNAVYERLEPLVPDAVRSMVQQVLDRPDQLTTVEALASALGVHRKTLFNRCERSGFLLPAELIVWCRLALVCQMLQRSGATIESIANSMEYPSATALRNTVKRYLGCTATEARERGAPRLLLEALRQRIEGETGAELHVQ